MIVNSDDYKAKTPFYFLATTCPLQNLHRDFFFYRLNLFFNMSVIGEEG
jgi:hypothetical protein